MSDCPLCDGRGIPVFEKQGYILERCDACDTVYVANPPSEDELRSMYSFESGYHSALEDPASADSRMLEGMAARHVRRLRTESPSPGALLDVGCATGHFLDAARREGWFVAGVDVSPDTAAIARESRGLDVHTGTLADAPFSAESFDVVTAFDVLEHVPDPRRLLADARRFLRPDGLLMLSTPNIDGLFPCASHLASDFTGVWPHVEPPYHLFQFSVATLRALLKSEGFDVTGVRHERSLIGYTFGTARVLAKSPKRLAYAVAFAPVLLAGPLVRRGDLVVVTARRRREHGRRG